MSKNHNPSSKDRKKFESMYDLIAKSEIGNKEVFRTPFGLRKIVYCDYTASGRALSFIEDFIRNEVLREYANTHSTATVSAVQTTIFRNEARDIIKTCVNASDEDVLLFVGSGVTGAIHKLISALDLIDPPVVVVSPFEHHSNLIPWRETFAEMIYANEAENGSIDLVDLERKLRQYKNDRRIKIGSFTAASNITGIVSDTDRITCLLHKYGFLSFWDYATAAPHVKIDMNPNVSADLEIDYEEQAFKDAIFISPHKFVGGPQTPGILIAKKKLFRNKVPNGCGGGTVVYVTKEDHKYLKDIEEREEGGTPAIVESIRAGLVFQLKNAVGVNNILKREHYYTKKAIKFLSKIPNLHLLGSLSVERLSIFSFLIKHNQTGYYLHSNFVGVLLNDLFGIQSRSGCACAGPYAANLIGMKPELSKHFEEILVKNDTIDRYLLKISHDLSKAKLLKPGFTRFNLSFFFDENRVDFILNAIKFVCEHGWRFLTLYKFNLESGTYRHRNFKELADRKKLSNINYRDNSFNFKKELYKIDDSNCPSSDQEVLRAAFKALELTQEPFEIIDERQLFSKTTSRLRWFLLSSEAYGIIHGISSLFNNEKVNQIFVPRKYSFNSDQLSKLYDMYKHEKLKLIEDEGEGYSEFTDRFYSNPDSIKMTKLVLSKNSRSSANRKTKTVFDYCEDCNPGYFGEDELKFSKIKANEFRSYPNLRDVDFSKTDTYNQQDSTRQNNYIKYYDKRANESEELKKKRYSTSKSGSYKNEMDIDSRKLSSGNIKEIADHLDEQSVRRFKEMLKTKFTKRINV